MAKIEDLDKLTKSIKDAEETKKGILSNFNAFSKEIDIFSAKEKELEENIKCLKKNRIIAIAQEFKKSKAELAKIRTKILSLNNDREHLKKSCDSLDTFIKNTHAEIDKVQKAIDNNVLQFNRGKNG